MRAFTCLLLAVLFSRTESLAQVTVSPAAPKAQETVRVLVQKGAWGGNPDLYPDPRETRVTMSGNKITVSVQPTLSWGFLCCPPGIDLAIGQFPAGDYQVEVTKRSAQGEPLGLVGSATFSVAPRETNRPLMNATGLWWNPSESGWGINIVQNDGKLFATWFVYGPDGTADWYHMSGGVWNYAGGFDGPIYRATGPYMEGCPEYPAPCSAPRFDPGAVTRRPIGQVTFYFYDSDHNQAHVEFIIDGMRHSKQLQRLSF